MAPGIHATSSPQTRAGIGAVARLVPRGRAAPDVGANKGVYSFELLKLASNVHAFEPNTDLMPWLSRLRHPRLTIHPYALGDCDREAVLRIPIGRGGKPSRQGATLARTIRVSENYLEMQTVVRRLDSITLGDVGFIKIDVEGFEMQVIEGASETIARSRPVMLVEIEPVHTGEPPLATIERIGALGYSCYALACGVLTEANSAADLHRCPVFNWIFLPRY